MHEVLSPAILYWGTPVVLITTINLDNTPNICPMSSAWWLAHRCMLGLAATSQTTQNILRTKQCVLNLASEDMLPAINALARTTGRFPVPEWKASVGYQHVKDKFAHAGLHPQASGLVLPPRIWECAVQMEAEMTAAHEMMADLPDRKGALMAVEVKVLRVHVLSGLRLEGHRARIDSSKLRPLFMVFQDFYGMGKGKVGDSRLAEIKERNYRRLTRSAIVKQGSDGEVAVDEDVPDDGEQGVVKV